jgi:hypothetical protein
MDVKELLDDDALDPKKFFDTEKYNTITVSLNAENDFKENDVDTVIRLLDENIIREEKDKLLAYIKEKKLNKLLMKAIDEAETNEDKARLLNACWESGLDFANDFMYFVKYALDDDFIVSMEAFTVAENIEELKEEQLTEAILFIDQNSKSNSVAAEQLKTFIRSKIN